MIKGTTRGKPNPTEALAKQRENSAQLLMLPATGSPTATHLLSMWMLQIPQNPCSSCQVCIYKKRTFQKVDYCYYYFFKLGGCFPPILPPNKQTFCFGNGSQCGPHLLTDAVSPTASWTQAKHLHLTKLPLKQRITNTQPLRNIPVISIDLATTQQADSTLPGMITVLSP